MTKKKSKIVGSTKPYTNPKYLKGKDKIKKAGRILGGSAKIPKPLDKKFVGCSVEHGLENWLLEEYKNFGSDRADKSRDLSHSFLCSVELGERVG